MQYVIFDFDGTLADSLPVAIAIARDMLGIEATPAEVEQYRNMTVKQILKISKIPLWKLPPLLVKAKSIVAKNLDDITLFDGLEEVIKQLADQDYKMFVVSSNGPKTIQKFLRQHDIKPYFVRVYGNVGLFSKAQAIKKVMKREGFTVDDAIYIGDEVRDIEAAQKIGLRIISVTWGYNGKKILSTFKPDYLIDKPADISVIIKNS